MSFTNVEATAAAFQVGRVGAQVAKTTERLSSGKRINLPNVDPGGLSLHAKLSCTNLRHRAAMQNLSNALSHAQQQEGLIRQALNLFQRMGQLATLATDELISAQDRENYDKELQELTREYGQYFFKEFGGKRLFGITGACGTASIKLAGSGAGTAAERAFEVETFSGAGTVKWDQFSYGIPDLYQVYHGDTLIHERVTGANFLPAYVGGLHSGNFMDVSEYRGNNYKPEPFQDFGEDGVAGTMDKGEGNGEYDFGEPFTDQASGTRDGAPILNGNYDGRGQLEQDWIAAQAWSVNEPGNPAPANEAGARSVFKFGPDGRDVNGNPYSTTSTKLRFVINPGGATVSDIDLTPNITEWEHSVEILPESNETDFSVLSDGFGNEISLKNVNLAVFSGYDLTTVSKANEALHEIQHVTDCLTAELSQASANAQRLRKETEENSVRITNTEAAEGRIMDLDVAAEAITLAKHNIRQKSSVAVMAQAQVIPNTLLGLLIDGGL